LASADEKAMLAAAGLPSSLLPAIGALELAFAVATLALWRWRTLFLWNALLMAVALMQFDAFDTTAQAKRNIRDAIKAVANGGRYLHPEMARRIAFLRADPGPDAVSHLSARELEILHLLAAGRTMAQIADSLNVSYKTIANNCTQLKQKLGARSAMDLMRIAIGVRN